MDDLNVLARDFGLGARGKSNPMRSTQSDRRSIDDPLFSDVFSGQPKYTASSNPNSIKKHSSVSDFDYDSIFKSSATSDPKDSSNSSNKSSSLPVYDKPVYDEDIFDGLPGLKSKSAATTVRFENDVLPTISSPPVGKSRNQSSDFDDLLGDLGGKAGESTMSNSAESGSSAKVFEELLPGFGSARSAASNRPIPEPRWGSVPTSVSNHGNIPNDPFVVLESDSSPHSSSGLFTDHLEDIDKLSESTSARADVSSVTGGAFDDLGSFGTSIKRAHEFSTADKPIGNSSFRYSESDSAKRDHVDNFQEPPLFDVANVSTDSQKLFDQTASPQYYEKGEQVEVSPAPSGQVNQHDDIWLTVSEIPLFTQPTAAPPPPRPPPPIPHKSSKSYISSSRKKSDEFSSTSYSYHHVQNAKPDWSAEKSPRASQFNELDDFAMGRSQNSSVETANLHSTTNRLSAAASSAAAMKYAMDKAEAKFRHAKEVREREYAKTSKDSMPLENGEINNQEREFKETQERLERERKQNDEEREMRRLERERLREIEREKARQVVERATREARVRAAIDARLKAERAAVEKANAEARERAERAAVQRAQAEARERAAAEAKERAERVVAEARERAAAEAREKEARGRAAAEAREKEARDRAALARAEAEARRRSERAAVDRAAAEARERASAEALERVAAASKMNQQKNDNDLESFFSMGRASSAPRVRTNSTDPFSDHFKSKGGSEDAKKTPPSGVASNMKKASTVNFVDDLSSMFGTAPSAGDFQEVEGETEERRKARLDRNQRTQERAAKALAEKNQRDLQAQREQDERHRIAETLDSEIKRWAAGKERNLRALLSTLQYVLWPECGWQPVSLTDLITGASVKKVYRKATLCIHPDKVQQKGASLQQKYIAEKVFDLLKEAWNKFNSEELF